MTEARRVQAITIAEGPKLRARAEGGRPPAETERVTARD